MKPIRDCQEFIASLEGAIKQKDKNKILDLYENNDIDWFKIHWSVADRYDELVDKANKVIGI